MKKRKVCILFGGMSPEHEVSLRSAEAVLNHIDRTQYDVIPVGITKEGRWICYGGTDYSALPAKTWVNHPGNRKAAISPVRGQGLLLFDGDRVTEVPIDVVFPVLHGENGEDGTMQGLMQMAGIPCVGPRLAASAVSMDKTLTKLVADHAQVPQAAWQLVTKRSLKKHMDETLDALEARFHYPMFVKPACTGSSVGVSKAKARQGLRKALESAAAFDSKILVEEFIDGHEVEVAVLGNEEPVASVCGEIDSGVEFYDYDAKYVTDTSTCYIPARISDDAAQTVRSLAVKVYKALGCRGLSRVDFFVTYQGNQVIFNEINTLPGFTSISMYPKLFAASGMDFSQLIDTLLQLAMEEKP